MQITIDQLQVTITRDDGATLTIGLTQEGVTATVDTITLTVDEATLSMDILLPFVDPGPTP